VDNPSLYEYRPSLPRSSVSCRERSPTEIQAIIVESGSTGTCPYTIVVWLNGTAAYTACNRTGTGTISPTLTIQFFEHVILALPFSDLPILHCLKPTSFRTTTIVQYARLFTLDISCPSLDKHIADLFFDTTQIQQVLGFSILRKP
jgi:hypothetical protein